MIRFFTFLALALTLPALASAQGDGVVSTVESKASMTYTLNVIEPPTRIRISGLEDMDFNYNIGGNFEPEQSVDVCVYISDDSTETYDLRMRAGLLTDGATNYVYRVNYQDVANPNIENVVEVVNTPMDQTISGFTANKDDQNCSSDGMPATLTVEFPSDIDITVPTLGATAQLTFTVSPN